MKFKSSILLLISLLFSPVVFAESFNIGGEELEIPAPAGFVRVTPEMDAVYRFWQSTADSKNDNIAYYIPQDYVEDALAGNMVSLDWTFSVQVLKEIKNKTVSKKDFAGLKKLLKKENKSLIKSIYSSFENEVDNISENISREFDIDMAIKINQVVPLDVHSETDNLISYSMYINYDITTEGNNDDDDQVAATVTYANVAGRLLYLYCFAPKDDMEWTRQQSGDWSDLVIAGNSPAPDKTPGSGIGGLPLRSIIRIGIFALLALSFVGKKLIKVFVKNR